METLDYEPDLHNGRPVNPEYAERGEALMRAWAEADDESTYDGRRQRGIALCARGIATRGTLTTSSGRTFLWSVGPYADYSETEISS